MKHNVKGALLDSSSCDIICFIDYSEYVVTPTNPILNITPPNFESSINIEYNLNGITVVEPKHIKHCDFPSGVYRFIQSICPNDKLTNEFCFLNICKELEELANLACDDNEETLEKLFEIKMELEIAQQLVSNGETPKGIELYNIAKKKLNKCKNQCNIC